MPKIEDSNFEKPIVIKQTQNVNDTWKAIVGFIVLAMIFLGLYLWSGGVIRGPNINQLRNIVPFTQPQNNSGQAIPLQEVKNLGYDFYVGQIDSPNTNNLTDDLKNQITKIVYDAHFPQSMLNNIPIIILNNLALTGDQYIPTPNGKLDVPDLKPDFLSEGGLYGTYEGGSSVIYINKPIIGQGHFMEVFAHELGHAIGSKITNQDWIKFYQLRGISSSTPRKGTNWYLSPEEDFAEVYMNTFTGIAIKTHYGLSESSLENQSSSQKTYSQILAEKRARAAQIRNALSQNSTSIEYSTDMVYAVNQATKDFIIDIMNRLNQK